VWYRYVWHHLFISRLILFQRTPESFVVIRIVVVEIVCAGGCGVSDFDCLVADPPRSLCVRFCYYFDVVFCLRGGDAWWWW